SARTTAGQPWVDGVGVISRSYQRSVGDPRSVGELVLIRDGQKAQRCARSVMGSIDARCADETEAVLGCECPLVNTVWINPKSDVRVPDHLLAVDDAGVNRGVGDVVAATAEVHDVSGLQGRLTGDRIVENPLAARSRPGSR